MKRIIAFAAGAALIIGMTMGANSLRAAGRTRICHVEGQRSGRAHVIEISDNAILAHLGHGDSMEAAIGLNTGESCVISPVEFK